MRRTLFLLTLALAVVATACASDSGSSGGSASSPDTPEGFPLTLAAAAGDVTLDEPPGSIVSLSATSTEILFAIGAGAQVVAVDDQSNFPPEAPTTDLSGLQPNVEAIAGHEPDLVVASGDPGDLVDGLATLEIPVLIHEAAETLDDTYEQIGVLGRATGHRDEANELVASMRRQVADLASSVPDSGEPRTYFHELDESLFSVTSNTFIGQVYELAGLVNIADEAEDAGDYPQLSVEFIVEQDPDYVFLADTKCCGQDAESVAERPGWGGLTAVEAGRVVELDDDIASRWGPRVVDFLETVVEAVASYEAGSDAAAA